jgi:hypothetical protein
MYDHKINTFLKQLEEQSEDDFDLLASVGSDYFSTADLLLLKGKWEERQQTFERLYKALLHVGASSPVWLLLGLGFSFLGIPVAATSLLMLAPIAFLAFIAGAFYLKRTYNSRGYLEYIGMIIDEELEKRKKGKKI